MSVKLVCSGGDYTRVIQVIEGGGEIIRKLG